MTDIIDWLERFITESNKIEGINRAPLEKEVKVHEHFLGKENITLPDLVHFVSEIQPGAVLRNKIGLNVRIGAHVPRAGGPLVQDELELLLSSLYSISPFKTHLTYEHLHPFTDGNGRSGRVLWLWQMLHGTMRERVQARSLGFLHTFYYQALSE